MNKISIRNIRLKSFRSFKNYQETGILPVSGIVGINGKNLNTNSSSGSGKSNCHLAVSYAFNYCPFPATELQSWLTEIPIQVEIDLDTPKGPAILGRGEKTFLKLENKVIEGARAVDLAIKDLIKIPIDLLEALTFRRQKTPGRFLSMTDSKKKEFLSQLLGLEEIEVQIEQSIKKSNENQKLSEQFEAIVKVMESELVSPKLPDITGTTYAEKKILEIKEEIAKKQILLSEYLSNLKKCQSKISEVNSRNFVNISTNIEDLESNKIFELIKQCESRIKEIQLKSDKILENLQEELKFLNKSIELTRNEAEKYSGILEISLNLENKIKGVEENLCPTCNQQWIVDSNKLEIIKESLSVQKVMLAACRHAKDILMPNSIKEREEVSQKILNFSNDELKSLKEILNQLNIKLAVRKTEISSENLKKIMEFNTKKEQEIKVIEEESYPYIERYNEIKEEERALKNSLDSLIITLSHIKQVNELNIKNYQDALQVFNAFEKRIQENKKHLETYLVIHKQESDFASLLKSFLGAIFEEVLSEIAIEANKMLKCVPNVSTVTIQFTTETITQKGKVNQEIKPIITKNGVTVSNRSGLSGGQETSVELAVDLSVGIVIGRRTGFNPGWLILDEPFDGHGIIEKEACLELLRLASKDKLIFVIDHATEIKDQFDKYIQIESIDDVSRIKELSSEC